MGEGNVYGWNTRTAKVTMYYCISPGFLEMEVFVSDKAKKTKLCILQSGGVAEAA